MERAAADAKRRLRCKSKTQNSDELSVSDIFERPCFFSRPCDRKSCQTHSMFSCTPGAAYYNSSSALFSSWHVHVTTEVLEYPEGLPWPMLELGRRQQPGMTTLVDCNGWIDHDSMITLIIIEMIMIIITGVVSRSVT